jgi:hypothetical protein
VPRRRSRAVSRGVLDWSSLLGGAVLLYHEFFMVNPYPAGRIPLLVVAAGLYTVTLTKPSGLLGGIVLRFVRQDRERRTGGDG